MKKRTWTAVLLSTVVLIAVVLMCASFFMLNYALAPDPQRGDTALAYQRLYDRVPDMRPWVDSLTARHLLRDTTITMDDGRKAHAIYLRCDTAHGRTAIMVHGYKDQALKFLYIGRMYHRLGCNILLPDLSAHGKSEGREIQMGWNDRLNVLRWMDVAAGLFGNGADSVRMVVHGVSMGAATTMCVAGEQVPGYVKCFVEDCGYTSAWDEFEGQLKEQFGLPPFPLMWTTSALCHVRYGWSFGEASALKQVAKCRLPMLFIHGSRDTFVPTRMVYPLYAAKPEPKELWLVEGSEHARSYTDHPQEYTEKVRAFIAKWMKS